MKVSSNASRELKNSADNSIQWEKFGKLEFVDTNCPVCGGSQLSQKMKKSIKSYEMHFVRCADCSTIYAKPRATEESLFNLYASDLFFEGKEDNINYYSYIDGYPYRMKTARRRLSRLKSIAPGKDLLEVASAAGFFLKESKDQGLNPRGVEISAPMAKWSSKQWNVPVTAGSIEKIDLEPASLDIIASWGVFTILRDPKSVLIKFNRALRTGGVLGLNTYYSESLWGKFWRQNWYILVLNTSQIFSKKALLQLLDETGFEVVRLEREWQYASPKYLLFQLLCHFPGATKNWLFDNIGWLERINLPVPLPDVLQ